MAEVKEVWCPSCKRHRRWKDIDFQYESRDDGTARLLWCKIGDHLIREERVGVQSDRQTTSLRQPPRR